MAQAFPLAAKSLGPNYPKLTPEELEFYRSQINCNFEQLDAVFEDCMMEAKALLSEQGIKDYLDGASLVTMIGRGFDPILTYLEEMPKVAHDLGGETLSLVSQTVWQLSRTPNSKAIPAFLQTIGEAARRLGSKESLQQYIEMVMEMMLNTTKSIHGIHATHPSPGAIVLFEQMPRLLNQLSLVGLKKWIEYGVKNYNNHPERQIDYFSLQSADARAVMQRERHGTLFMDNERTLDLYLRAMWPSTDDEDIPMLVPYSEAFDELRKPQPYYDQLGFRIPDVFDDKHGVTGMNRYRSVLAHMAAHKRWSGRLIADNYSPFQRISVETFEDCRVDTLAMQKYPGLRKLIMALHPRPDEFACNPEDESCIRHRLAMMSYAMLVADHGYENEFINEFAEKFREAMKQGESSTKEMASLGLSFVARTRLQSDQLPKIYFKDTEVHYRDDNRHLWQFIEEGDEEEMWDKREAKTEKEEQGLPPRHYPEWDYNSNTYRPDWVSLYESLHPSGNAAVIDKLLSKHDALAKQLKRMLDMLKPQNYVRVRYQEEGSELDLDVAIRSLIDFKSGAQPDPRINMSHQHNDRNIAVMLLLDLSESLNEKAAGSTQTILELSQEAVALTSWAVEQLGDEFAIAGFCSNSRHEVRYQHIKGFAEHWDDEVKGRLAAMEAGYSTRMGAAIRHAAHYLEARKADKKLLLILTDGEPADIDVHDDQLLIHDSRKA
ncbi:MAG TPA: VWA domain-containing protein, partial [Candidatus Tenderia electrophaga]|nr:VWA domain-containing protein [Candidatus Tenderia electrophaga]